MICASGSLSYGGQVASRNDVGEHRSPDGANGSRECAPDDKLREIRDSRDAGPGLRFAPSGLQPQVICPLSSLISDFPKDISVPIYPKSHLELSHPTPPEGRIMIVTDAGRDAVDAAVLGVRCERRADCSP